MHLKHVDEPPIDDNGKYKADIQSQQCLEGNSVLSKVSECFRSDIHCNIGTTLKLSNYDYAFVT